MSHCSGTLKSIARLTIMSLGFLAFATVAYAAVPPAATVAGNSQNTSQIAKLVASAMHAEKVGNLPLATIQLKNALRLDPTNGRLETLLGIALLQGNDHVPAEHELRQGRLDGAKDQDAIPPLLQCMVSLREWQDILDQFPEPAADDKSSLATSILNARALAYQSTGDNPDAISSIDRSLAVRRDVDGLVIRARIAMLQSSASDAMTYVNQALALSPNDTEATITKAVILSASNRMSALALIDSALKVNPNSLNLVLVRIELLIELGQTDEAQRSVDAVLSNDPNAAFATFYKALLLGAHNKPLDGWRIAQSLPSRFIQSETRYAVGMAQLAAASGNLETANSILTTYVGQNPSVVESRLQLATLHLKMKSPSNTLDDLAPLMDSTDPAVLEFIANTYSTLKRPSDAVTYMRKADAAGSNNSAIKYQLALVDLRQGNTSQGRQEMLEAMKLQSGDLSTPQAGIDVLISQSKFSEAQAIADQAEKANPKNPAPPFFKGEILLAQGKKDESAAALDQSLLRDPHFLPALDAKAQIFLAENKYADATKIWNQVQEQQPNSPTPYVKLAQIAALSKQPTQSIALLRQAIAKDPKRIDTGLVLARYQIDLKQYADAEATLKTALQVSPKDARALTLYGQVQQLAGQTADAINTNKTLVRNDQGSAAAQTQLANSLLASGDKKGAVAALKRAVALSPDAVQYPESLINAQIQSGDSDGALVTARDWANNHNNPDGAILLAQTLAQLKHFDEATSTIAASQKSSPNGRLAILDSQIASARGDDVHALSILKNWLADHTSDISVREAYAGALMHANDNASALAQYEIIQKSRNDIPAVLNNMAWLLKRNDLSRALTFATEAVALSPNSPDINDTLGSLLLQKGDAKAALPVLQQAHASEPTDPEISYHLAVALNSLGRKADAKLLIQTALAKDDKFADAASAKKLLQNP
jgi:putative PEP-CTERM system TPR-repeat lipoprotein